MGCLKNCYTTTESSGNREIAVLALYEEPLTRNPPPVRFNDLLGEPIFSDTNDDQVGESDRPETIVELLVRIEVTRHEQQDHMPTGNAPDSMLMLVVQQEEMEKKGLFLSPGIPKIRPNDRLLRIQSSSGVVRADFAHSGRQGLFVYEVRVGDTGVPQWEILVEDRKQAAR